MIIDNIYKKFPERADCINLLEAIRWQDGIKCPYCGNQRPSKVENEDRYHCNKCHTSFSVTVGTPFHRTRIDLQKWFAAIYELIKEPELSARDLAIRINVTKDTALLIKNKLRHDKDSYIQKIGSLKFIK